MTRGGLPPEIERSMFGFIASHVLFTTERLGMFESLAGGRSAGAHALASEAVVDPDALDRLLTAGVALGILQRVDGGYRLPEHLEPFLLKRGSAYCCGMFSHLERASMGALQQLDAAVREGGTQWKKVYGDSVSSPFDFIYAGDDRQKRFLDAMWAMGYGAAVELAPHVRVEEGARLVDLGGGSGSFAVAMLERWPQLSAAVADLPAVEPLVVDIARRRGLSERLSFTPCNFFEDPIPEADLIALGYILSDWSYTEGTLLLRKVHASLRPGGHVIVLERLFDEDRAGPVATAMMDLCMMLETRGRHRSATEYLRWLAEVGFSDVRVVRSSAEKHMVLAKK